MVQNHDHSQSNTYKGSQRSSSLRPYRCNVPIDVMSLSMFGPSMSYLSTICLPRDFLYLSMFVPSMIYLSTICLSRCSVPINVWIIDDLALNNSPSMICPLMICSCIRARTLPERFTKRNIVYISFKLHKITIIAM